MIRTVLLSAGLLMSATHAYACDWTDDACNRIERQANDQARLIQENNDQLEQIADQLRRLRLQQQFDAPLLNDR